jgi:hypothetical protein
MLLVGLFAPGELCSAAACLGMLYYFILAHQVIRSFLLKLTLLLSYHRGGKKNLSTALLAHPTQEKSCACAARLRRRVVPGNCGRDDIQAMGGGHARQRVSLPLQQTGD